MQMSYLSFNFINIMKRNILTKVLSLFTIFAMTFNVAFAANETITICHVPPGNEGNPQTLNISINAWENAHDSGTGEHSNDYEGPCDGDEEPAPLVCAENLSIVNGGFENPLVGNESGWQLFPNGTVDLGWTVTWVSPDGNAPSEANLEIHGGVNGWEALEGGQYAELGSDYGDPAGGLAATKISQEFDTIEGATYEIAYSFAARPNTSEDENILKVYINGDEVESHGPVAGGESNLWSTYFIEFAATGDSTEISFEDAGTVNSVGTFLDDVSVICVSDAEVPEVCLPIVRISENGREGMVKVTKVNPRWVPSIAGTNAKWVWNNASIPVFPDRQDGGVFTVNETINIVGNPQDSEIKIAADNVYSVVVNGDTVYAYSGNPALTPGDIENIPSTDSKFSVVHEHTIPANYLNTGLNTIKIRAVNQKWTPVLTSESTATNPAGLMYALTINEDCDGGGDQENDEPADEQPEENDESEPNDPVSETEDESVNIEEDNNQNSGSSSSGSRASGGGAVLGASTEGEVLGACVPFAMYHKKGDVGGEVAKIQEFLNEQINAGLTVDGVYNEATEKAVHSFQQKYFEQVISPWVPSFMARTTGKWYKTTRMMANKIIDCPEAPVYLEDPKIIYEVKW